MTVTKSRFAGAVGLISWFAHFIRRCGSLVWINCPSFSSEGVYIALGAVIVELRLVRRSLVVTSNIRPIGFNVARKIPLWHWLEAIPAA